MKHSKVGLAVLAAMYSPFSFSQTTLDAITVTATKEERKALDVSQSVDVADRKTIEDKNARNINDVIKTMPGVIAVSKNGGYDSRLIIRGAGLKARYGVREIMVMRDGVPMTDPDSFTRFDFIDIDDMESVEVFKGPGSIEAANASGGVISVRSISVFDDSKDYFKVGAGSETSRNAAIHKTWQAGDDDNFAVQLSRRQTDNNWREHNQFDTTQFSVKQGHFFADDSTLETELSYQESNMQLPSSLNEDGFAYYKNTGETLNDKANTGSVWSHSARDSKTLFFNTRYKTELGNGIKFNPQFYVNKWEHLHPVTGFINDSKNNYVVGTDLMFSRQHSAFGKPASQVFGLTMRADIRDDSKKYKYRDITTIPSGRIVQISSDEKGDLAQVEDASSQLSGAYFQQTVSVSPDWTLEAGLRYDHLNMDISGQQYYAFDYAAGGYKAGEGAYSYKASYDLFAPKVSANYALNKQSRLYGTISGAQQAPTDSEVSANYAYGQADKLKASTALQYELGYKLNASRLATTVAVYQIDLTDEIVGVKDGWTTYYVNAGKTQKRGAELSASYRLTPSVTLGGSAAWQDYQYLEYEDSGNDYSGNQVRFIPEQQYNVFVGYQSNEWQARMEALGFGSYYIDDANSEKYDGYQMVSNMMLGYEMKKHKLQLNVNNVFDMRYAEEVSKDTRGTYAYTPGAPRNIQLNYRYQL
ncbi:Catecholate siderophore receptor Fiu [Hydrogenovibrio crunogenus]|uniref:Catecholate siderophore receptor Fiu n=1 Tax=Hydrogenovibrio crunogenus TaxID=39765 RepID=A0A4P7P1P2_9GAMM|nr:TonB-dependent receptor [Hydrogenovibrio crunogenus]QBZ84037.1 Catecholate siderophore receptor Fiu [Hydrogenovibrio crunogenus]